MNPRTCIISREEKDPSQMIRFVVSPDNQVVPDLKGNLPGRGAWVTAKKASVDLAATRKLFPKAFAKKVDCQPDLGDFVERLLADNAVQALAMAKKAGAIVTGFSKVDAAIRNGEAALLFHASDASEDGRRKLSSAVSATVALGGPDTEVFDLFGDEQIGRALGNDSIVHIAVKHGGVGVSLMKQVKRYKEFLED